MKLAFSISRRFLASSKGQTALIVIGIVIGVAVQVFIGSLIDGLQASLVDRTIGSSSQITIVSEGNEPYFSENDDLLNDLVSNNSLSAVSPAFSATGFLLQDDDNFPVLMRGFNFEAANEIYNLSDAIVEGDFPATEGEILIGTNLAEELELVLGDTTEFTSPGGEISEEEIVGIFDLGVASLNESWVITELNHAQALFGEEGNLSSIEMQAEDVFEADVIAAELKDDVAALDLETSNWKEENEQLLSGLSGQSISSYMIQVFVLIAVLLGIASVLAISATQKSKQLGILKAMGIKDRTAGLIFLFQGFLLGTIGSIIGAVVGVGLMYGFSTFVLNADGTPLVPFYVDYQFIGISVGIAIVSSTIAAFIPAKNSSKLNPIEVIQGG